jgi:hypothetical protein
MMMIVCAAAKSYNLNTIDPNEEEEEKDNLRVNKFDT